MLLNVNFIEINQTNIVSINQNTKSVENFQKKLGNYKIIFLKKN